MTFTDCQCDVGCGWMDGLDEAGACDLINAGLARWIDEPFSLGELKNMGPSYVVDILSPDGRVINRLSVDKQTGNIHFLLGPLQLPTGGTGPDHIDQLINPDHCDNADCHC